MWGNGMQKYYGGNRLQIAELHSIRRYKNHFEGTENNTCSDSLSLLKSRRELYYRNSKS
jgi:hypothetical protein